MFGKILKQILRNELTKQNIPMTIKMKKMRNFHLVPLRKVLYTHQKSFITLVHLHPALFILKASPTAKSSLISHGSNFLTYLIFIGSKK